MTIFAFDRRLAARGSQRRAFTGLASTLCATLLVMTPGSIVRAQTIDCGRLQQQIARGGGGSRLGQSVRRQSVELARTQAYAHQLGCDGFTLFGSSPQCGGLTARIAQLQANMAALQAGAGEGRSDLVARYNAYCRGAQAPQPQPQRGFFESLFGGFSSQPTPPAAAPAPIPKVGDDDEVGSRARGGSQAVCVRTCDGGFFPLALSARHSNEDLTEMCQALCPGTETAVFTRNPDSDIKSAAGLDGRPYMDLPNALHFQKTFTPACSCRQPGKSWSETLANAEEVLDSTRKGDIVVTPEKSAELSRPKLDPRTLGVANGKASIDAVAPKIVASPADAGRQDQAADGSKRSVRQVGPQP